MSSKDKVLIGTAGYSYPDWIGPFYPRGLPRGEMLAHYAGVFSFVEINSTYYRVPQPSMFVNMIKKTPQGFLFTVKAPGAITHERNSPRETFDDFRKAVRPLVEEGRLGCILFQFPYSFNAAHESRNFLRVLAAEAAGLPAVVEFRHRSWCTEDGFRFLAGEGLGYVCVDEPPLPGLMPPVARLTSPTAYLRLHGRNAAKWWRHKEAWERYDYLYRTEELEEWAPKIEGLQAKAQNLFISFNNHFGGQAVRNAGMLRDLLAGKPGVPDRDL